MDKRNGIKKDFTNVSVMGHGISRCQEVGKDRGVEKKKKKNIFISSKDSRPVKTYDRGEIRGQVIYDLLFDDDNKLT